MVPPRPTPASLARTSLPVVDSSTTSKTAFTRARDACAFCLESRNLRRTVRIALVVGVVLTVINQGAVTAAGDPTAATWVRCALSFVVPFLVSNAGLLSGRSSASHQPAGRRLARRRLIVYLMPQLFN